MCRIIAVSLLVATNVVVTLAYNQLQRPLASPSSRRSALETTGLAFVTSLLPPSSAMADEEGQEVVVQVSGDAN